MAARSASGEATVAAIKGHACTHDDGARSVQRGAHAPARRCAACRPDLAVAAAAAVLPP